MQTDQYQCVPYALDGQWEQAVAMYFRVRGLKFKGGLEHHVLLNENGSERSLKMSFSIALPAGQNYNLGVCFMQDLVPFVVQT